MNAKEFALAQIKPYYQDPSTCGMGSMGCEYLTPDGRMCVLGKNLIDPKKYNNGGSACGILSRYGEDILKPEARGMLSIEQWNKLQNIHDIIAWQSKEVTKTRDTDYIYSLKRAIKVLELFTYEELIS